MIDLRSDTVTRPSAGMREAMATAEVGDDVYGDDPTVNRLQSEVAALLGMEAALFVPSGTMANQVAMRVHTRQGDEVLAGRAAHCYLYESGAAAALAGLQITTLPGDGRFAATDLRGAYKGDRPDHHLSPTTLLMVENTHNMAGGVLWDRAELDRVLETARDLGMKTHLDGARLWNAAAASGESEASLARGFDSVSVCLSKGLGAPVGSLVVGTRDFITAAHRARKMHGGGMRQAGILAAAGLFALEHNRAGLRRDHENAAYLARALAEHPAFRVAPEEVHTNIVMCDTTDQAKVSAPELAQRAAAQGLLFGTFSPTRFRLVTHLDVDSGACERAVSILRAAVA